MDFLRDVMQPIAMPVLGAYQALRASRALNVTLAGAGPIEALADALLAPVRYAFGGRRVTLERDGRARVAMSFRYERGFFVGLAGALALTPAALLTGGLARALGLLSRGVRARRAALARALAVVPPPPPRPVPCVHDLAAPASPDHARPPEPAPTRRQRRELDALRAIVDRLEAAGVVHWIDCGTALGAYRHGGFIPWDHDIDLAIPTEEHARARAALAGLALSHRLRAEDWSAYTRPATFVKVRVGATGNFIDLYHHTLDPDARAVAYDFTFAASPIPASWKRAELTYTTPIPLDVIFPLRRVLFEGVPLWAPRDLEAYLHLKYGPDLGPTRVWDPATRTWRPVEAHPWWRRVGRR